MNPIKLLLSSPFRYALAYAVLFAVSLSLLFAISYWATVSQLERQFEEAIEGQVGALRDDLREDGRGDMLALVGRRVADRESDALHYLVQDSSGRVLAGDLPASSLVIGWQDLQLPNGGEEQWAEGSQAKALRAFGSMLDEDTFLMVARDTHDLTETRELILHFFAIALTVTEVLALAGGVMIALPLLSRVDAINRTMHEIMAGDFSRRVPLAGNGDELDRFAQNVNAMLGRIEELMQGLRHVTNDIAHDLRTPLTRLRQRLESARLKAKSTEDYDQLMVAAIEDTDAILQTFAALLRIAEIEAGARRGHFTELDLSAVLENVVEAFEPVAEDRAQTLSMQIERGVRVRGDKELLTQMFANLIENALRHTGKATSVEVSLARDGDHPEVSIGDDGPGIPEEQREKVLGPFYRLDASRSTPGSGLGLSLVAAIAKLHDATLTLEDNRPGVQARVRFREPVVQ